MIHKNANLVNSISDLRKALLVESFWIDSREYMPSDEKYGVKYG